MIRMNNWTNDFTHHDLNILVKKILMWKWLLDYGIELMERVQKIFIMSAKYINILVSIYFSANINKLKCACVCLGTVHKRHPQTR